MSLRRCTSAIILVVAACGDGDTRLVDASLAMATSRDVRVSELQPGAPLAHRPPPADYREDSVAVWEGMRLYNWYNCNGCHGNGGGAIGPPLADDEWIYGSEPAQIHASILEGRPDGMPAYAGRMSDGEAWRIVAYVRSLAGLAERRDGMWPVLGRHMRDAAVTEP